MAPGLVEWNGACRCRVGGHKPLGFVLKGGVKLCHDGENGEVDEILRAMVLV